MLKGNQPILSLYFFLYGDDHYGIVLFHSDQSGGLPLHGDSVVLGGASVLSHFILLSGTNSLLRTFFWVGPLEKNTLFNLSAQDAEHKVNQAHGPVETSSSQI